MTPNQKIDDNEDLFSPIASNFKIQSQRCNEFITNQENRGQQRRFQCIKSSQCFDEQDGQCSPSKNKQTTKQIFQAQSYDGVAESSQSMLNSFFQARGYLNSLAKLNKSDISYQKHIQKNDQHGQKLQKYINYHIEQVSQIIGQKRRLEKSVQNYKFQLKNNRNTINKTLESNISTKKELKFQQQILRDKQNDRLIVIIRQIKDKIQNYSLQNETKQIESKRKQARIRALHQKQQLTKEQKENDQKMQHNKAIKQDLKNNLIERKNEQNELQNKLSFYRKTENIRMQRIIQKGKILKHIVDKETLSGKMYSKKRVWKEDMDHVTMLNELINNRNPE